VLAEIAAPAFGTHLAIWQVLVIEGAALLSLALFFVGRQLRLQSHYLDACFGRERLRHLRFQLFLNGPLIETIVDKSVKIEDAVQPFISAFNLNARNLPGVRAAYQSSVPSNVRLMVPVVPYTKTDVAKGVYQLLRTLRFEHQIQYSKRRLANSPLDRLLSLREQFEWAEVVGRWSLFAALVIPAVQLTIILGNNGQIPATAERSHLWLSVVAIAMAIIGMGSRAYQRGMGVPEEIESYESYASHVESMLEQFITALQSGALHDLHHHLQEMELEAERELRRFLAIKSETTFLM
jgi:hypothetical protein